MLANFNLFEFSAAILEKGLLHGSLEFLHHLQLKSFSHEYAFNHYRLSRAPDISNYFSFSLAGFKCSNIQLEK